MKDEIARKPMSNTEAIEILKRNFPKTCKMVDGRYKGGFDDTESELGQALLLAISALEHTGPIEEIDLSSTIPTKLMTDEKAPLTPMGPTKTARRPKRNPNMTAEGLPRRKIQRP